jgi:hypothetical protein
MIMDYRVIGSINIFSMNQLFLLIINRPSMIWFNIGPYSLDVDK